MRVAVVVPGAFLPHHLLTSLVPLAVDAHRLGLDVPGGAAVFWALPQVAGNLDDGVRVLGEGRGLQICRAASWHQA